MEKFKIGDKVRIVTTDNSSINRLGDIGIISEIDKKPYEDEIEYRVYVKGRTYNGKENIANWQWEADLELIEDQEI
jgi:hypothetical protein